MNEDPIVDIINEHGMSLIRGDVLYRIYIGERTDDDGGTEDCYVVGKCDRRTGTTEYTEFDIDSNPRELMENIGYSPDDWRQFFISPFIWQQSYIG